jgi:hypothetical protein
MAARRNGRNRSTTAPCSLTLDIPIDWRAVGHSQSGSSALSDGKLQRCISGVARHPSLATTLLSFRPSGLPADARRALGGAVNWIRRDHRTNGCMEALNSLRCWRHGDHHRPESQLVLDYCDWRSLVQKVLEFHSPRAMVCRWTPSTSYRSMNIAVWW